MSLATFSFLLALATSAELSTESVFPLHPLHNHSSSIVELSNGDLLVAWYRGSGEGGADDVQILGARKSSGTDQWTEPFVLADTPNLPDLNPVLFVDPQGRLWLFYSTYLDNSITGVLVKFCIASDHGKTGPPSWDEHGVLHCQPHNFEEVFGDLLLEIEIKRRDDLEANTKLREIFEKQKELVHSKIGRRLGWMTRTQPLMVNKNCMMIGLYHDAFACAIAAFTEDGGDSWQFSEPIQSVYLGAIQPSFARHSDGTLVAFLRDNGKPKLIRTSESLDDGMTWSRAMPMDIPNPGSSVAVRVLDNGDWILICNDLKKGRHRLSAYLSEDEGRTWWIHRVIEDIGEGNGEVHYPTAIQTSHGTIHVNYTYTLIDPRREMIKVASFQEAWVRGNEEPNTVLENPVLAFPGAEGYGRFAKGGRGGDVYIVTNLNDHGPGSIREGIESASGPRTIVFETGGTIELKSPLKIDQKSRLTIAGQTARGDGITLKDHGLVLKNSSDLILRYLRIRLGDENKEPCGPDVITADYCENLILDHLSASWGIDGIHDTRGCKNYTLQWCILSEALHDSLHPKGPHAMCASFRAPLGNMSIHHNIFATCRDRHPTIGGAVKEPRWLIDFRNNLIYNWSGTVNVCDNQVNLVNNFFRPGPETTIEKKPVALKTDLPDQARGHMSGNFFEEREDLTADNYAALDLERWFRPGSKYQYSGTLEDWKVDQPYDLKSDSPRTQSAQDACEIVLNRAGASLVRDGVDMRVIKDIRNRTGLLIDSQKEVGGWPELEKGIATQDTDRDGMTDEWESEHGLDLKNPDDRNGDFDSDGFTNLEEYLADLID
ncbi:MAG: exo-alpha-sialidase [Candidatus Omnitrophica bacterium]|nr:exo-alpha-sialidase [Candidatus Omnitrophota bacterium]